MNINIFKPVKLKPDYYQAWNDFCYKNTWFWHTQHWIDYLLHSKFGVEFKDHSFFIDRKGQIVDVVPLIQQGDELYSPGFSNRKEVLQEVRRIALENGIKRIQADSDVREYLNISGYTCVLDLDKVHPTKGHNSAIKRAVKYLIYRQTTDIDRFKQDYFLVAGKPTRPDRTFELLGEWLKNGFGTLLAAEYEGETAGYVYILHWKNYAYYFMSCVIPKHQKSNVTHFLQWQAFEILRQKGIQYYEMGDQPQNSLHNCPSDKEKNIAVFKKGFGGQIIVKPKSEYFFDADYMRQIYTERINNYIRSEYDD